MNISSKSLLFLSICLFFYIYPSNCIFSNPSNNTPEAFYEKGIQFFKKNQIDSFYYYFVKANNLYKKNESWNKYVKTCNGLAHYFWNKQQYDSTETYLQKASNVIQTYHIDSSSREVVTTLQILGALYETKGYYEKSAELLHQSLEKKLKNSEKNSSLIINTYNTLAALYGRQGDYDAAIEYYQQALNFATRQQSAQQARGIAGIYNNIAITYQQKKDYVQALKNFRQYYSILSQQEFSLKEHIVFYNNLGVNYLKMEQCDTALHYIQKALDLLALEDNKSYTYTYTNLGRVQRCLGNHQEALKQLERALQQEITVDNPKSTHPTVGRTGRTYKQIAITYQELGELSTALQHYQQAMITLVNGFEQLDSTQNPTIDLSAVNSATDLLEILKEKAHIFSQLHERHPDKKVYLSTALNTYQTIDTLITQLRQSFKVTDSKYFLTQQSIHNYEESIQTALHLAKYQPAEEAIYKEQAFHFVQKNKAVFLSEILRDMKAKSFAKIPDSLREKEQELKIDMAFYEKKKYDIPQDTSLVNKEKKTQLENKIFQLKQQQRDLVEHIEATYPKYHELKYDTQTPTIAEIQEQLSDSTALIDYFLGDSTIFTATITKETYEIKELAKPDNFEQLVSDFRKTLTNRNYVFGDETAFEATNLYIERGIQLYQLLLEPSLSQLSTDVSKLIIIPDGILGYLNFEILLQKLPKNGKLTDVTAYLLHRYQISYAYSSTLWLRTLKDAYPKIEQSFAGFAPMYKEQDFDSNEAVVLRSRSSKNIDLPFAREEVTAIANLVNGEKWLNQKATEQTFKSVAPDYDILHLSMHGIFDDQNPLYSSLIFTQNQAEQKEDGYLTVAEIYNMQFKARLAVLSACNTGYGKLRRGEGIMSLARAFAYSGCPSMVMSLWSVPEKTTANIMVNFYKELRKGETKDAALRKAKLAYLSDDNVEGDVLFAHPYFWAGFVPIGDMKPLNLGQSALKWWHILPVLLLMLIGIFLKKKN